MMHRTFQSATLKLTAYYMAIIMVVCIMFSAAIYHFANSELQQGLLSQSQRIVDQYPGFDFTQALRSTREYQEGSHRILLNLVYFNVFVLVMASFAGYELARRTLRPIEESHEQQKRFTADVSHELRTPLTALKMSTEVALLDTKAGKTALRQALASNLEEAGKLELLINNLLRLTRLEASELQQGFTTIDLREVLQETIDEAGERTNTKHVSVKNTIKTPLTIAGDRSSLIQLFAILLDNALKYSPEGASVEIKGQMRDGVAAVSIIDHGIGIDSKALPHIFERFYRADEARTRNDSAGFGLGLSIAKHIADLHAGIIHVSSTRGRGTTVRVELPTSTTLQ